MPERAHIVYKVSKPALGPEVITSFGAKLNWALNLRCSCWHLNSLIKIGEFLHLNKETFTIKLTF